MRFKLSVSREPKHSDVVSAVGWSTSDEVLSGGDDHLLVRWNLVNGETTTLSTLPETLYPTDIHWFPKSVAGAAPAKKGAVVGGGSLELFVLSSADGKFFLITKGGRVEKTVEAHGGAVLSVRWSYDGSSLLTVGEDGLVKIWSRGGMLRSTLAANASPVYSGCWSPDNSRVLFCCGRSLTLKPLQPNSKPTQWKAHDETVLKVDWNACTGLIVSGGEDCKYKIWDSYGRPLYSSGVHESPITAVSWSPDGERVAIGSFNTLHLCDKAGWSHSMDKPKVGSVFNLSWSPDGTQIAGGCANGHVIFAHVIEGRIEWKHLEAMQTKRRTIEIRNVANDSKEKLEVKDRIIKASLGWDYLVVATSTQCYVFNSKNWNTPLIFDLKEGRVTLIEQAPKQFLLVDGTSATIYNYEGRQVSVIKFAGMRTDVMSQSNVAISNDTVAIRDKLDPKIVHIFDAATAKPLGDGKVVHTQEIVELAMDQCGSVAERRIAFIDINFDLLLACAKPYGSAQKIVKLGSMLNHVMFNDTTPMLASVQDSKVLVWYFPSTAYVDKELLPKTVYGKEMSEFGKNPRLLSFRGTHITARRVDGSVVSTTVPPFPVALHAHIEKNRWDDALRLCRQVKDDHLWATLAATAAYARNLHAAEVAYAAINEAETVQFLRRLKGVTNKDLQNAEMALFCGNIQDAEGILLQSGLVFRAIFMNTLLYRWDRALELAVKHRTHVETVLAYREKYLESFGKKESNKRFIEIAKSVDEVDWDSVQEKIETELAKERIR